MEWERERTVKRRPNPYWLDNIDVTSELLYRYQINSRSLSDVLTRDLFTMKQVNQVRLWKYFIDHQSQTNKKNSFSPI